MEFLILTVAIVIIAMTVTYIFTKHAKEEQGSVKYAYFAKKQIMTNAEKIFYEKLLARAGESHYIVPQAHLSTFIDHRTKGQHWKAAFSVINGKSVDFLMVEKATQKPVLAIELDDYTHSQPERVKRDRAVEEILRRANIPLERYSSYNDTPRLLL